MIRVHKEIDAKHKEVNSEHEFSHTFLSNSVIGYFHFCGGKNGYSVFSKLF